MSLKMSCQKLIRRYLHLVHSEGGGLYSLRHMDLSKLFYPSIAEALDAKAQAKMMKKKKKNGVYKIGSIRRLPRPSMYYQPFLKVEPCPLSAIGALALLGERKNKILWSDNIGNTSIYNTDLQSLTATRSLNSPKAPDSVVVSIPIPGAAAAAARAMSDDHTDNLFMLDMRRGKSCCFEVLNDDSTENWCWDALPPPPFFKDQEYEVPIMPDFTVVDKLKNMCVNHHSNLLIRHGDP